jgi:nicotinamidase-related amidase/alkylated DNA repair dioxygenase AlkB
LPAALDVEIRPSRKNLVDMAASLLAMLSQQAPNLPVRKGLLLTGLQHDFLSPDGKLPVSNLASGFLDRTISLVKQFRGHGDIIWVRTEINASKKAAEFDEDYCNVITSLTEHDQSESDDESDEEPSDSEADQTSRKRKPETYKASRGEAQSASKRKQPRASHSDNVASTSAPAEVDKEHFLTRTPNREACFIKGTGGVDFGAEVKPSVLPTDLQLTDSCYSAFCSTSLLSMLRSKLITELYVCGAMSNLNVYATSVDAARYGIKITLVEDCLGYRQRERHDLAIKRLVDIMEAEVATSDEVVTAITGRPAAARPKHEVSVATRTSLGANIDTSEDTLEVASSDDEEDDGDLLLVRSSPLQSGRPLEIRGKRPQGRDLQEIETGSEPHSQLQRHASPKPIKSPRTGERETKDNVKHLREVETVEFKSRSSPSQPRLTSGGSGKGVNQQVDDNVASTGPPKHNQDAEHFPPRTLTGAAETKRQERVEKTISTLRPIRRKRKKDETSAIERMKEQPLFGPGKEEESSKSSIKYDLLPPDRLDGLFNKLKEEVIWQRMHHQTGEVPRLVCCQGTIDPDGSMPIYRHPSDETLALLPWTSTVDEIRQAAEAAAGHTLNHALIQLYRTGTDYISEHSDKTLDIAPDTFIVNASFGAERVMRLKTKRTTCTTTSATTSNTSSSPTKAPSNQPRTTHRIRLPHNSTLLMSLPTNAKYLHSINPDKRASSELTPAEKAYKGQRISLTFRKIATFLDADSKYIWGQGSVGKDRHEAGRVVGGGDPDAVVAVEELVKGFGAENAADEVRWSEWYGGGSDVLHLK